MWFCSSSHKQGRFSVVAPCLWFPPYDLLWLKEWSRNGSMPVLSLSLKKSWRFPPALLCFGHCDEKNFLLPAPWCCCPFSLDPKLNTWSRATLLTYRSEAGSKVAQPTCKLLFEAIKCGDNLLCSITAATANQYSDRFFHCILKRFHKLNSYYQGRSSLTSSTIIFSIT